MAAYEPPRAALRVSPSLRVPRASLGAFSLAAVSASFTRLGSISPLPRVIFSSLIFIVLKLPSHRRAEREDVHQCLARSHVRTASRQTGTTCCPCRRSRPDRRRKLRRCPRFPQSTHQWTALEPTWCRQGGWSCFSGSLRAGWILSAPGGQRSRGSCPGQGCWQP